MPAKKTTILIADDDPQLLRLMARNLEFEGYEALTAADGQQTLELIENRKPDLILLDVMMPKLDGFSICQRVRQFSTVPIIIITARGNDQDKIRGLDLGADDYLTKPFNIEELLARSRAVLRRASFIGNDQGMSSTTIGDLSIDFNQHKVMLNSKELALTPIEYRLLSYMAKNIGRVMTQDLLLKYVWGSEYIGESHMLQVNINRLRRKLEPDPTRPRYLRTKVGVGYMLVNPEQTETTEQQVNQD
ncbi:response regulator transcription factor [Dictyobacter arantiisoli]|uniref:DNA-binding response regulator n=1 Tax=Dictyobacter arantiisoli TaxID=2014874 RepID=A0A5A5TDI7_9CHLR|nr:response regulator transcription factor [Dictyobacter arantiisoli]GCF09427.1 DNA-binding response regulator [Dictyobacter arantiisoli]